MDVDVNASVSVDVSSPGIGMLQSVDVSQGSKPDTVPNAEVKPWH